MGHRVSSDAHLQIFGQQQKDTFGHRRMEHQHHNVNRQRVEMDPIKFRNLIKTDGCENNKINTSTTSPTMARTMNSQYQTMKFALQTALNWSRIGFSLIEQLNI